MSDDCTGKKAKPGEEGTISVHRRTSIGIFFTADDILKAAGGYFAGGGTGLKDLTLRAKSKGHREASTSFCCTSREENAGYRVADSRDDHYGFGSEFDDLVRRGVRHGNRLAGSETRERQKRLDTKKIRKPAIAVDSLIATRAG